MAWITRYAPQCLSTLLTRSGALFKVIQYSSALFIRQVFGVRSAMREDGARATAR